MSAVGLEKMDFLSKSDPFARLVFLGAGGAPEVEVIRRDIYLIDTFVLVTRDVHWCRSQHCSNRG